jgi:hypothetical protein
MALVMVSQLIRIRRRSIRSLNIRSLNIRSLNIRSLNIRSLNIRSLNIRSHRWAIRPRATRSHLPISSLTRCNPRWVPDSLTDLCHLCLRCRGLQWVERKWDHCHRRCRLKVG